MNFFRQHRPANPAPKVQEPVRRYENPIAQTDTETYQPWPRLDATFVGIVGFIITAFFISSGTSKLPSEMAHLAAVGVGLTLLASFAFELRSGLKNVVRADLVGILAFYSHFTSSFFASRISTRTCASSASPNWRSTL